MSGKEWWGAAEGEVEDASWKTGSEGKRIRIDAYIEWLLTPASFRDPESKTKLAASLGVSPQTLRNYDRDPYLQRKLQVDARALARVDRVPEVLQSLFDQARDSTNPRSVAAAKTFLDYVERATPGEVESGVDVEGMSSEELASLAVSLLQKVSDG